MKELVAKLPEARFVYYSDNAHCPYGDKTAEYITDRSREISKFLISKGASAIVVACNTATSASVHILREEFDLPIIGMEPAVKPAALSSRSAVVGVLATEATLNGAKYLENKSVYEDRCRIVERVGVGFVELVESLKLDGEEAESIVRASLQPLLDEGADTIVLGCTHYPFLLPLMRRIAPTINFIDPAPAVARHLSDVLQDKGIACLDAAPGVELYASGPDETLRSLYGLLLAEKVLNLQDSKF